MEELKWLFRSIVALLFCVMCVGGGTAIPIIAIAKGAPENIHFAALAGLALSLFGGYLVLLVSPVKGNIRLSGSFGGLSIAMSKDAEAPVEKPMVRLVFGGLALLCASVICVSGGIGVAIVALARGTGDFAYIAVMTGISQTLFGGYMAISAVGARPLISASGSLQDGVAIEFKEQ